MLAPAATLVTWTILDLSRGGKATAVGAATAIIVGLVAVTPAAGFVSPLAAGDGMIFVVPVERVYRIRTAERDEAAVTPVGSWSLPSS